MIVIGVEALGIAALTGMVSETCQGVIEVEPHLVGKTVAVLGDVDNDKALVLVLGITLSLAGTAQEQRHVGFPFYAAGVP